MWRNAVKLQNIIVILYMSQGKCLKFQLMISLRLARMYPHYYHRLVETRNWLQRVVVAKYDYIQYIEINDFITAYICVT